MPLQQSPPEEPTKEDLMTEAQALDVEGRSSMNKEELAIAVGSGGSILAATLDRIAVLWSTVGYDTVNDQPVKSPTPQELEVLADELKRAAGYVKALRK